LWGQTPWSPAGGGKAHPIYPAPVASGNVSGHTDLNSQKTQDRV
jgi:hypothetical protein